jgi:hypothetical protein
VLTAGETAARFPLARRTRDYSYPMTAASLSARLAYTVVATPLGWAAGFYSCMRFLPEFTISHSQIEPNLDDAGIFRIAICAGAAIALTASLCALTLPWIRHRKTPGRSWRLAFSCVLVVLASIFFADLGFRIIYDLLFAAWLTYLLAFTFVRYGVTDQSRRASSYPGRHRSRRLE